VLALFAGPRRDHQARYELVNVLTRKNATAVIAAATNFEAATPRLAPNAVSTTLALLSADIKGHHLRSRPETGHAVQEEQGLAGADAIPEQSQCHRLLDTRVAAHYHDPAAGSIT